MQASDLVISREKRNEIWIGMADGGKRPSQAIIRDVEESKRRGGEFRLKWLKAGQTRSTEI